jgi:hypothetical protein
MEPRQKFHPQTSRSYRAGVRHYHRPNEKGQGDWDEWIGDRLRSPWRAKVESFFVLLGTLVFGAVIFGGILYVIFFAWGKVLPMIGK